MAIVRGSCLSCGQPHSRETDHPEAWLNAQCGSINNPEGKGVVWCICGNKIHGVRFTEKIERRIE